MDGACVEINMVPDPVKHELGLSSVKTQKRDIFIWKIFKCTIYPSILVSLEDVKQALDNMTEHGVRTK